jgi:hypothetical protein
MAESKVFNMFPYLPRNKAWMATLGTLLTISIALFMGGVLANPIEEAKNQLKQQIAHQSSQMTLVFGSLLRLPNEKQRTIVQGLDVCPAQESDLMRHLFGETGNAGRHECLVVSPSSERVLVRVFSAGKPYRVEEWKVQRDNGRIGFQRSDGSSVVALVE